MKKLLSIILSIIMSIAISVCFTGCDNSGDPPPKKQEVPVIKISTNGASIDSKVDYVDMTFSIEKVEESLTEVEGGIRLRGNTTMHLPKKPYRIKFDKKQSLFGLPSAKSWVLLAEYLDPSALHNYTAFNIASQMPNLAFTPTPYKVELYLNGEYQGLYTLCEQVQENAGRMDIELDEITADMTNLKDFNFFISMDQSVRGDSDAVLDETYFYLEEYDRYFELKYPEKDQFVSNEQFTSFFTQLKEYVAYIMKAFTDKNVAVKSTGSKLYIKETATLDYDTYNDFANGLINTYKLSGVSSSLRLFLNVNVNGVCADFESKKLTERTTTLMIPLTQELVDININASLPYHESSVIVCGKNDKNIFKVLAISLSIIELVLIIELIVYIYATRNDDINYEIKVKRLVNAYKSYIQKILTEFNCDGYQVLKVDTFNEMLDIRDTVNLPILMSENSDKTCTTFVIPTNNNILYLHEIKVDDYDEIYASTSTSEDEIAFTETVDDIYVSETVEDISVDETLTEEENETSSFRGGLKYNYSFLAKLHLSSEDTRDFYREIATFVRSYGLKVNSSWNKERIQVGKKTYAILSFKGLKLTVSFALNPADYEGTKYKLIDVSAVKKFAKVPAQMKITSYRKVSWVKELFNVMLKADGVENKEIPVEIAKVRPKTKRRLIKENLIKVEK